MANMSYCRMQNTLQDLSDCYSEGNMEDAECRSDEERKARYELIVLCHEIASDYATNGVPHFPKPKRGS